jgi:hypothetical protein
VDVEVGEHAHDTFKRSALLRSVQMNERIRLCPCQSQRLTHARPNGLNP